jgi:2-polyprenyl-3-methyl-5-hydroxy-6-metoxy-1,4-benzoquinol methylase
MDTRRSYRTPAISIGHHVLIRILRTVTASDQRETIAADEPADYLSGHFRSLRAGLGYDRRSYAMKAWRTFGSSLPVQRDCRVLEIGPGECEFAELLTTEGYTAVSVVDMSPEVISVATALGLDATLVDDTVEFLERHVAHFDCVVMLHVLEHVPKTGTLALLRALHGALRPGGVVLIEVPNMGDPLNGLYFRYSDFTHEVGFTEESLRYVLTQSGFGDPTFLEQIGADGRLARALQRVARRVLHGLLFLLNLPNGRQMRRRIGPVLSVRAPA